MQLFGAQHPHDQMQPIDIAQAVAMLQCVHNVYGQRYPEVAIQHSIFTTGFGGESTTDSKEITWHHCVGQRIVTWMLDIPWAGADSMWLMGIDGNLRDLWGFIVGIHGDSWG